ncbi:putative serine/threonine-protein kinase isoform X2 [Diospyros lotus]|uniref:putative serine/threonine-protein kinase isoform X2 n=1 Tax=Diospyros lotus TaxID=55363 RepID=UPI002257291D|nr:putative serine/threonine-protein kinase isoform X2 [Diospyros lotus]
MFLCEFTLDKEMKLCFPCFCPSSSSKIHRSKCKRGLQTFQAFTYNELKASTNNFRSSSKIGRGGFGTVYKGKLEDGRVIAVKMLSVESKQGDREFMAEIASMSNVSHDNLVKLHGGCVDGAHRIIVYEYLEKNNLAQTLLGGKEKRMKIGWKTRYRICLGIAQGLAYIHEQVKPHIVHRDIKASNILLDRNFAPKISDFGLSKLFPDDSITHISTRVAGTLGYLAPEYAVTGRLTRKSDIYSFGVLLLEIVSGRSAVDFNLHLGEHYLVERAWDLYNRNKLVELVDPMLAGKFPETEAVRLLKVGLLCVQEACGLRPRISRAVRMIVGEIEVDRLEIMQPGLITDITNIKIADRQSSPLTTIFGSGHSPQSYLFFEK